jgi:hypothetical protein
VLSADNKCEAFVMEESPDGFGVEEAEEVPVEFEVGISGEFEGFGFDGGGLVGEEVGFFFVDREQFINNFFAGVLEVAADVFHLELVNYGDLMS